MIAAIADTHTTIWYLFSDPRLSSAASAFIDTAITKGNHIGVSAITLVEMTYLIEKGRIAPKALKELLAAMADPKTVLEHVPLDKSVAAKVAEIPRQDIPDLPDRVIAATGLAFSVPVLSRDGDIRSSAVRTIW